MNKGQSKFFNQLRECPWWVSVIIACTVYIGLSFVLQNIQTGNQILVLLKSSAALMTPYLIILLLIPAPFAYFGARRKRRQLDIQTSIDSINSLPWKAFEKLVTEAYRRQGYQVVENGFDPDGGIDIRLLKSKNVTLVQCKRWRSKNVGVCVVREMFGILTAQTADKVIIISCVGFTSDAVEFAENKPIELKGGAKLLELVAEVQTNPKIEPGET